MSKEITLEDYKRAYREMEKEEARRGFIAHLVIYILVNIMNRHQFNLRSWRIVVFLPAHRLGYRCSYALPLWRAMA